MCVRSEHGRDLPVEVPSHRHLLARHLRVEVDDDDVGVDLGEDRVDLVERTPRHLQADRAAEVDHPDPLAGDLDNGMSPSRISVRVVGRPDHPV